MYQTVHCVPKGTLKQNVSRGTIKINNLFKKVINMKIQLSGGFHNSNTITLYVKCQKDDISHHTLSSILSTNQLNKIEKHFCDIKGCTCGSYMRSIISF